MGLDKFIFFGIVPAGLLWAFLSPMLGQVYLAVFIGWPLYKRFAVENFKSTDEYYSEHGVIVNYAAKTISIKGKTYPVTAVKGFSSYVKKHGTGVFSIKVDDMKKPVYELEFNGLKGAQGTKMDVFQNRLEMALQKAGGHTYR